MVGVGFEIKKMFFDKEKVLAAEDKGTIKALSKIGAYLRTAARGLLRRRKRPSLAGDPPSVHSTDSFASLKNILFGYDSQNRSVVVGPVKINGSGSKPIASTVPHLLEAGGTARIMEKRRRNGSIRQKEKTVHYEPRPFMKPALEQVRPQMPAMFDRVITP